MMKKRGINGVLLILLCLIMGFGISVPAMAASKKPSTPKLVSVKQAGANAVTVSWAKAKNAKQYELYASVNKGKYKKLKTVKGLSFRHTGVKAGATYTYKIRAVNGKNKSAFSKTKSVKIKKGFTPSSVLSVNVQTVTVKPNQTAEVVVTFTHDGEVEFNIGDESIVECKWQDGWYGGGDLTKLYITGKRPGATIVTISNDYNGETCNIAVNVQGNTIAENYAHLKTVILNSGITTEEGNPCISYSKNTARIKNEFNIIYVKETGDINFFMSLEQNGNSMYCEMYVNDAVLGTGSAKVEFAYFPRRKDRWVEAETTLRLSGHTKYSTYFWNQTDGEGSIVYQDLANTNLQLSFTGWDIAVMQNAGITLRDLGFTSYE